MAEDEVRELQEQRSSLKNLIEHPGYKWLMKLAESQRLARTGEILLNPLKTMDEVLEQEYKKGEVHGIMLFETIAESHVLSLEEEINRLLEDRNDETQTS